MKIAPLPLLAGLALALSVPPTAEAQTLTRLQGAQGRQLDNAWPGTYARIELFLPDDRFVLTSIYDGIVPGDTNGWIDAAAYDLWTGSYQLLAAGAGGAQLDGEILAVACSASGNFVVLDTRATNLGFPDANGEIDVVVLDRSNGSVQRVSLGQGGVEPNGMSSGGEVSDDGRWVVFQSYGDNLLPGDANDEGDVFVRDMSTGNVELVSVSTTGGFGNGWSQGGEISADGRFVLFTSHADDLVAGDTNGFRDLFLRDRQSATTVRLNLGPGGVEADGEIYFGFGMTPDARWICFDCSASNLHPLANGLLDVFRLDRLSSTLTLESPGHGGVPSNGYSYCGGSSDDGSKIVFMTSATNLDPGDLTWWEDIYVRDVATGTMRLISRSTAGSQGTPPPGWGPLVRAGTSISPSGRRAAFMANFRGLAAGDTNLEDEFLYDAASPCAPIESYGTAKTNSLGCTPTITSGGEPFTSGPSDSFFVSAHAVRNHQPGLFLWSLIEGSQPFYGGTLFLAPPVWRTPGQLAGGSVVGNDCTGTYSFHFSQAYMNQKGLGPGALVHGQYWSRDNGFPAPDNVGLTGGLRFVTGP